MMITSFFLIICHSRRCFQTSIYSLQNFSDILLILPPLEFLQKFHHHYHGDCRILANGTENIQFGMLLLLHYNFGQKTLIQLPLA